MRISQNVQLSIQLAANVVTCLFKLSIHHPYWAINVYCNVCLSQPDRMQTCRLSTGNSVFFIHLSSL